jgi:cytochrome c-type biogenesis protein CcmH
MKMPAGPAGFCGSTGERLSRFLAAQLLAILLAGSLASPGAAAAQRVLDRPNAAEAERAIDQLRSPYCPGFMLSVCTSSEAAALRDSIYDLAAVGATSGEIVEWMVDRHGEEWRAVPQRSGAGLWAWIIPPFALILGLGAALAWLRAHRVESSAGSAVEPPRISEDDRLKLAAALRDWEESGEEGV